MNAASELKTWTGQRENFHTEEGNPEGGYHSGPGFIIVWQKGPELKTTDGASYQNGAQVEQVLMACKDRLQFFMNHTKLNCEENEIAFKAILEAYEALMKRTHRRMKEGTEGSYEEESPLQKQPAYFKQYQPGQEPRDNLLT